MITEEVLCLAIEKSSPEVNYELLSYAKNIDASKIFLKAAEYGRLCLLLYIKRTTNVNIRVKDINLNSPLHLSAANGYIDTTIALLHWYTEKLQTKKEKMMQVNEKNNLNMSPLHLASFGKSEFVCKYIIYMGGDRDLQDSQGMRAYDLAKNNFSYKSIIDILKPRYCPRLFQPTERYREKSLKLYILNLSFLIIRIFYMTYEFASKIYYMYLGVSLTLSLSTLFLTIVITTKDPGFAVAERTHTEDLYRKYSSDVCVKCNTVQHKRNSSIKHCWDCGKCINRYDHHCPWVNNCIGKNNSNWFLAYLLIAISELTCHSAILILVYFKVLDSNQSINFPKSGEHTSDHIEYLSLAALLLCIWVFILRVLISQINSLITGKTSFEMKLTESMHFSSASLSILEEKKDSGAPSISTKSSCSCTSRVELYQ
ncbi:hypothetical protein SteCoe_836 [Stentor coeruleus]|uniref:Palmitoyltransferase n=1 Tax=Stentor coeruleus TaxID=5963 RepID=A0A1R2D3B4_9CILI|nr:hypothetical protein SteCoe_836 [Stentor coeruleus]